MVFQSILTYLVTKSKFFPQIDSNENAPLCSVDNVGSSTRSRLLRSESISPKVRRSSLLMPASTTEYEIDISKTEIPDHANSENQQSEMLDEAKKAKKNTTKGVSMSEVIRLHQVRGHP